MAIRDWSTRRIAALWLIGGAIELVLLVAPVVFARAYAERNLPRIARELARMKAEQAPVDERWRVQEAADSVSIASQRRAAIVAGEYSVNSSGDTLVAVVAAPSGRPDPVAVQQLRRRDTMRVFGLLSVVLGAIPLALVVISLAWLLDRRRRDQPPAPA